MAKARAGAEREKRRKAADQELAEAAAHARRMATRARKEVKRILGHLCEAAISGQDLVAVELPDAVSTAPGLDGFMELVHSTLRDLGFRLSIGPDDDFLAVEWSTQSPELCDLGTTVDANVLAWVASTNGQLVLGHFWRSIERAAKRGKSSCNLMLEAIDKNKGRWGDNQPYVLLLGGKPSGCLLLSPTTLSALLLRSGFECSWAPRTDKTHQLSVSW